MEEILKIENLSKRFPGVRAVDNVSFGLRKGEILALVGENGAGKSTLTSTLGGVLSPDSGRITLKGKPVFFQSSHDAIAAGISMVFQELSLVGTLSVAENIFANRHPVGPINNIRWRRLYRETSDLLRSFKLDLDPMVPVKRSAAAMSEANSSAPSRSPIAWTWPSGGQRMVPSATSAEIPVATTNADDDERPAAVGRSEVTSPSNPRLNRSAR